MKKRVLAALFENFPTVVEEISARLEKTAVLVSAPTSVEDDRYFLVWLRRKWIRRAVNNNRRTVIFVVVHINNHDAQPLFGKPPQIFPPYFKLFLRLSLGRWTSSFVGNDNDTDDTPSSSRSRPVDDERRQQHRPDDGGSERRRPNRPKRSTGRGVTIRTTPNIITINTIITRTTTTIFRFQPSNKYH